MSAPPAPSDRPCAPISVLLADDEEVMRQLVRLILERAGLTVLDEAEDGLVALDRYRSFEPPTTPRVVLLDNQMPGMTGLKVAEEILAAFPTQIVVLFSAHLDAAIEEAAGTLGVAACVPKGEVTKLPGILDGLLACA